MANAVVKKLDGGKLRLDLVPAEWIEWLGRVCQMGAEKYSPWAWAKNPMEPWRVEAALMRHVGEYRKGNWLDDESGLPHLVHAAWNCLCLVYYREKGLEPKNDG